MMCNWMTSAGNKVLYLLQVYTLIHMRCNEPYTVSALLLVVKKKTQVHLAFTIVNHSQIALVICLCYKNGQK